MGICATRDQSLPQNAPHPRKLLPLTSTPGLSCPQIPLFLPPASLLSLPPTLSFCLLQTDVSLLTSPGSDLLPLPQLLSLFLPLPPGCPHLTHLLAIPHCLSLPLLPPRLLFLQSPACISNPVTRFDFFPLPYRCFMLPSSLSFPPRGFLTPSLDAFAANAREPPARRRSAK